MPALPSFITYRPGKKAKAAIKAPFSLLRGDSSTASSPALHQPFTPPDVVEPDVIDINHSHYSDGGNPSTSSEQDVFDNPRSSQQSLSTSPQVELDIDLSSNGFSDWLEAFSSGDAKKEAQAKRRLTRLTHLNVQLDELKEGEGEADRGVTSSEDMIAGLQAIDAEQDDLLQESSLLKHPYSISIPDSNSTNRQASRPSDLFIGTRTTRPLSSQSDIASSAISGTTIARALMSNSFILSTDPSSLYRSGTGAGLTRTDSATLPSWEWNSHNDRFSVGSDAPPIPLNAELLYEPPRRSRNEGKRSKQSSIGSLSPKIPPETPSISNNTRFNSVIVSADVDLDLETLPPGTQPLENPLMPPRLAIDEAMAPDQASQQTPVETQRQDPDIPSSPLSSCHTSPKELEGLLNYYSLPDSPELLVTARGFRPMFSPITEESSSQLSPPTPYRSDKRDSERCQPVGGRSPLRARDSAVLPMKDPHAEEAQSNITCGSSTTISDSSFYVNGGDNPDLTVTPPQPNKFFSREKSGSIPIKVVRNSSDLDAYNLTTASSFGDATLSAETPKVSQEFPETPDPFSPMLSARPNAVPPPSMSAVILESVPPAQLLSKRTSVQHSRQGSLSRTRSTPSTSSGSPSIRIDISESPEPIHPILSPIADDEITEDIASLPFFTSESSANPSSISLSLEASGFSDSFASLMDLNSPTKSRNLPSIPMISPILPSSPDNELPPISHPGSSTIPVVLEETIVTSPSPTPPLTVKPSVPRGRLPTALTISSVSEDGPVAANGTVQEGQNSAELESQQPQHDDSPGAATHSTKSPLAYRSETYRSRASDIFRGTSLGSPPPYYSVVSEALQDNRLPNFSGTPPFSFSQSQGSDNISGPSSGESTFNNDISRPRENSLGQRTRTRPPLPAGPRRPSQSISSPGPRRGSFSSVSSSMMVPDPRNRPPARYNNPTPSPSFQTPTPKWKGYTLEVARWTFTSAQLQAIVSKAIKQSAEASSIRLLRLEVLDDEIPEEIQRLETQRTNIKMRYKATTRRRATILDSMYSSLGVLEDVYSAHRLARQLDELKEMTQTLDRLTEELHSVDRQLSHLESLTHIHNGSALAIALRKINSSFLQKVAENQVLRGQIQSLEAERDEAWQQAQSVANEYDQINDYSPTSTHSSRVSAKRKSCIRVSRAGLRTPSQRRSSVGGSATKSPPLPLPINKRRPMDILTDSPGSSNAFSTSGITPSTGSRELAEVQDELYSMLGIVNPERRLHRSRSEIISPVSPRHLLSSRPSAGAGAAAAAESPRTRYRRDSLPGALSLTEAYNVMAVDRNAVLATIDMLKI